MKRLSWMIPAVAAATALAPRAAHAEDIKYLTIDLVRAAHDAARTHSPNDVAGCLQHYDLLHAAGVDDATQVTLNDDIGPHKRDSQMTYGEIHASCVESKHVSDVDHFTSFFPSVILEAVRRIDNHENPDIADLQKRSKECADEVDRLLADGASPAIPVEIQAFGYKGTLGTVKAEVCLKGQPAVDRWMQANLAPFIKAGIKNDKLKMILEIYPEPYYLAGGRASIDPRQLAKASVWFFDSPHDGDSCNGGAVTHTLHRYAFDKNQTATETTRQYCGDPPARAYR
jgi:hypothetical protein